MGHRRRVSNSFLRRLGKDFQQANFRNRLRSKGLSLRLEQFEARLVMDGAGFVNTNPPEDTDTVIGVAGVEAHDDYFELSTDTEQIRFDVLANDPQPAGGETLHIKSVSETALGAGVSISDDGQRIIYTPAEGGFRDSFYYIVEDSAGNLGKANVNVTVLATFDEAIIPQHRSRNFSVYEDGPQRNLDVLRSQDQGEIVEVRALTSFGSSIAIADDGKSLIYQPAPGVTGAETYEYTVATEAGESETFQFTVYIEKPFVTAPDWISRVIRPGVHELDVLANDWHRAGTPEQPRIVDVSDTEGGTLTISDDGRSLLFDPWDNYLGRSSFTYTVQYGPNDYQRVEQSSTVEINNSFLAVDDWYSIPANSSGNLLEAWRNDRFLYGPEAMLAIVEVGSGSQGGTISLEGPQGIRYTPQAGFVGEETFTYTVEDADGHRDTATVTLLVTADDHTSQGVPKFISPSELEHFLIDQAVAQYGFQFGVSRSNAWPVFELFNEESAVFSILSVDSMVGLASRTNTQETGIDEADITETNGRFVYTFSDGKLAIVDLLDPANPQVVSLTDFGDAYSEMYLQDDRLTLIHRGGYSGWCGTGFGLRIAPYNTSAVVTVLDLSDRSAPTILERTEIDGRIVDSRAVGDQVYVTVSGLNLPPLELRPLTTDGTSAYTEAMRYETLDEYVARVRETLIEEALPNYRTYDGEGNLVASGLLTDPTMIHKPVNEADNSLLSLITFDVSDDQAGPLASAGIFTSAAAEVYMSGNSYYVMRSDQHETTIFKFTIDDEGTPSLVATGKVDGRLLNQFSVDEHEGRFRIATTDTLTETYIDRYGNERTRQLERVNHLFVLEQNGATLEVVGRVENLAPTETIKSVRFMDDVAYVVTFRVIDPLFVIDLSDATNPKLAGSLKIPGYSDYLHPVGEDYLLGIGRDANEITGELGPVQISLFYVGDMSSPTLVDQVSMEGTTWSYSEAWWDHHAVAYFEESQILTLPVSWYEGGDYYDSHSAIWTFQVDVDQQGGGSLSTLGSVEHDSQARRSILLGTSLVTISQDHLKVNNINDLDEQLADIDFKKHHIIQPDTSSKLPGEGEVEVITCFGELPPELVATLNSKNIPTDSEPSLTGWHGLADGRPVMGRILFEEPEILSYRCSLALISEGDPDLVAAIDMTDNEIEVLADARKPEFSVELSIDAALDELNFDAYAIDDVSANLVGI